MPWSIEDASPKFGNSIVETPTEQFACVASNACHNRNASSFHAAVGECVRAMSGM